MAARRAAAHAGGDGDAALSGLAVANLPFVEELYFQFLNDPASVDPELAPLLPGAERERRRQRRRRGGAGAADRVPAQHLRRAPARPSSSGAGHRRQPHLGPAAVRARAAPGRGLPRARAPDRQSRSARAGAAQAAADRARGLRARRRGSGPGVQQRERRRPGPDDAARSGRAAARDLQPHHRRRAGPPARRRAALVAAEPDGERRATGWC